MTNKIVPTIATSQHSLAEIDNAPAVGLGVATALTDASEIHNFAVLINN
jgi:hypothetical protein